MKTAISLPDELGKSIEIVLKKTNMSRSEFFQRAARIYLDRLAEKAITQNLNEVYSEKETSEDVAFRAAALQNFQGLQKDEEW